jgi:hypothetical protein
MPEETGRMRSLVRSLVVKRPIFSNFAPDQDDDALVIGFGPLAGV